MATLADDVLDGAVQCLPSLDHMAIAARSGAALAIGQRVLPKAVEDALGGLDWEAIDDVELTLDLPVGVDTLALNLAVSGYPSAAAHALAEDILALAMVQARATGSNALSMRLQVVETDSCRKFHADYVTRRLLTTYAGQATQWCHADKPDRIEQLSAGDVAIFTGRVMIDPPVVLHRSPPIEAAGELRLLLVIDPAARD
ncbi:DUF1826 domain-containing protein [Sphingomonas sp. BGYR3]|uniref:DUF1826 domain-containing protein n=1 Tax=Sphingomonas sp. BGYR3 TaxID=2975483 RepID=UPI0021A62C6C|nr:DUF1826 domain-containing protein [Sphingomonas sp. BGYR3]MDG5487260.1 DUF1826 domain-containing protein [Sphingomonas sp. BGYR3]